MNFLESDCETRHAVTEGDTNRIALIVQWNLLFKPFRNLLPTRPPSCTLPIEICGWAAQGITHYSGGGLAVKLCLTLATLWTVARQAPLSIGFSRQEYWSGLLFHSPGDLPDPEIELGSPALQADSLPTELRGKPNITCYNTRYFATVVV